MLSLRPKLANWDLPEGVSIQRIRRPPRVY